MIKQTPEIAIQLLQLLPKRPDYDLWIHLVSAIANTFDEQTALRILLTRFTDEKPSEHLNKIRNKLKNINFGTLVHYAQLHRYQPSEKYFTNHFNGDSKLRRDIKNIQKRVKFTEDPELLWKFASYEYDERAAIYEYEAGLSRLEAERRVLNEFPDAKQERVYRISVNKNIINKNQNPKTSSPFLNYKVLTNGFQNYYLTLKEICENIGKGFPFCCCHLKQEEDCSFKRKNENFLFSELFAIDIDSGLSIENCLQMELTRKALLVYTTVNHTDLQHRFRLLFALPRLIKNPEVYKKLVKYFISQYNSDPQCKDLCRPFYSNRNATIYIIATGKIVKYREGVII